MPLSINFSTPNNIRGEIIIDGNILIIKYIPTSQLDDDLDAAQSERDRLNLALSFHNILLAEHIGYSKEFDIKKYNKEEAKKTFSVLLQFNKEINLEIINLLFKVDFDYTGFLKEDMSDLIDQLYCLNIESENYTEQYQSIKGNLSKLAASSSQNFLLNFFKRESLEEIIKQSTQLYFLNSKSTIETSSNLETNENKLASDVGQSHSFKSKSFSLKNHTGEELSKMDLKEFTQLFDNDIAMLREEIEKIKREKEEDETDLSLKVSQIQFDPFLRAVSLELLRDNVVNPQSVIIFATIDVYDRFYDKSQNPFMSNVIYEDNNIRKLAPKKSAVMKSVERNSQEETSTEASQYSVMEYLYWGGSKVGGAVTKVGGVVVSKLPMPNFFKSPSVNRDDQYPSQELQSVKQLEIEQPKP